VRKFENFSKLDIIDNPKICSSN